MSGTRNICDDESDLTCSKCRGKNCNNDFERRGTKCMKCEGIDCFNAGLADTVHCPSGGCYVGLNLVGETKRDCQSVVSTSSTCVRNDSMTGECLVCQGDFCNSILFPMKNRLICKECIGETCEEKTMEDKYCEKISADETCVSLFDDSDYILERGCSSTVQHSKDCAASNSNCIKCSFDGCNIQVNLVFLSKRF